MKTVLLPAVLVVLTTVAATAKPPMTQKHPVVDVYHGVAVEDDYRWLENWNDKEVRAWSDAQNVYAREWLNRLPNVKAIRERLTQIMTARTVSNSQ